MVFLYPYTFLLTALIMTFIAGMIYKRRFSLLIFLEVFLLYMLSTPFVANTGLQILTSKVNFKACSEPINDAILLAGGLNGVAVNEQDITALSNNSLSRASFAISIIDDIAINKLIISGGAGNVGNKVFEADIIGSFISTVAIKNNVLLEKDILSQNTKETAINYSKKHAEIPKNIYLITSDWHMYRAQREFNKQGINICPLISRDNYVPFGFPGWFIPQKSAIVKFEYVWHELGGLLFRM